MIHSDFCPPQPSQSTLPTSAGCDSGTPAASSSPIGSRGGVAGLAAKAQSRQLQTTPRMGCAAPRLRKYRCLWKHTWIHAICLRKCCRECLLAYAVGVKVFYSTHFGYHRYRKACAQEAKLRGPDRSGRGVVCVHQLASPSCRLTYRYLIPASHQRSLRLLRRR